MIFDAIQEWFQELLIDGIISNLTGMFDTLNTKVGEIAGEVGMTPAAWNSGIFNMIRSLSETVIVPIAGIILTFVMCYELIQLIVEKNNLHDFDTWIFFKWIFKSFCAVLIVTNTWNIVMAVFDVAQNVVNQSAGVCLFIQRASAASGNVTAAVGRYLSGGCKECLKRTAVSGRNSDRPFFRTLQSGKTIYLTSEKPGTVLAAVDICPKIHISAQG